MPGKWEYYVDPDTRDIKRRLKKEYKEKTSPKKSKKKKESKLGSGMAGKAEKALRNRGSYLERIMKGMR